MADRGSSRGNGGRVEIELSHELFVGVTADESALSGVLEGLAQQVAAQVRRMALTDGLRRRDDRQALVASDVARFDVFVVEAIGRWRLAAAQAVAPGERDVWIFAGFTSLSSYRSSAVSWLRTPSTPYGHKVALRYSSSSCAGNGSSR